MDEEKNKIHNNIENEIKEDISKQLDSFMNSKEKSTGDIDAISYYSNQKEEDGKEPIIKVNIADEQTKQINQGKPIIRTFKSDVEETIQEEKVSSADMMLAESRKKLEQSKTIEIEQKKNKINKNILIISIILIIGGILIFTIPKYLLDLEFTEETPVETVASGAIITVDSEEKINLADINTNRVATTLKERVNQASSKLGQVKNIYLTEGTGENESIITSTKFLELIGATVPSEIIRTIKSPYMFGMYNYNGNQRFLILKVGSYDNAFSGMLYWEANLWNDFKELFDLKSDTSIEKSAYIVEVKKFQDATYNNKDCRVVKDTSGNIIFLYSIIDDNTIVITTSIDTFKEINNRVNKSRTITQ